MFWYILGIIILIIVLFLSFNLEGFDNFIHNALHWFIDIGLTGLIVAFGCEIGSRIIYKHNGYHNVTTVETYQVDTTITIQNNVADTIYTIKY